MRNIARHFLRYFDLFTHYCRDEERSILGREGWKIAPRVGPAD